jgi:HlyD family secretion protein
MMKIKTPILIVLVAAVVVAILAWVVLAYRSNTAGVTLRVSGNIEVTDAAVSFKSPGRVLERLVDEGQMVAAGQVVARLDSAELVEQRGMRLAELEAAQAALAELEAGSRPEEIAQAKAAMDQSQSRLNELLSGSRIQEIASAEAGLKQAQADATRARVDFERYARLYQKVNVSAQQFDAARTAMDTSEARQRQAEEQLKLVREGPRREQIDQARAALEQTGELYEMVKKGPRKEQISQARARVNQAQQSLFLAETQLGYATLTAPFAGRVLSKNVEPGEYVSPGTPVITIGNLANVWLRAYINETDLARVKLGQRVSVTSDSDREKKFEGHISFIASEAEFTPKSVQTEKERVKLVFRIKIDIPNPNQELKPGMPADAVIQLEESARVGTQR